MKFEIKKNDITENYNTVVLEGIGETREEYEWLVQKKMRLLKQTEKGRCISGFACFCGKGINDLQRSPDKRVLKEYKRNYQALWHTILLFKRRF